MIVNNNYNHRCVVPHGRTNSPHHKNVRAASQQDQFFFLLFQFLEFSNSSCFLLVYKDLRNISTSFFFSLSSSLIYISLKESIKKSVFCWNYKFYLKIYFYIELQNLFILKETIKECVFCWNYTFYL